MTASQEPEWLTIQELSGLTRIPVNTLYVMNSRGDAPPRYRIGKRVLYRRPEVIIWMESFRVESGQPVPA